MAGKHTPGPWRLLNGFDIFSELGADSGDGCPAASNDGWHVAVIPDTETNVDGIGRTELGWDVKRANARLIAAAPDLLEALELAVRQNDHDMLLTGEELRLCRAAIARATQPLPPPNEDKP